MAAKQMIGNDQVDKNDEPTSSLPGFLLDFFRFLLKVNPAGVN